jgi:hypothetical protein
MPLQVAQNSCVNDQPTVGPPPSGPPPTPAAVTAAPIPELVVVEDVAAMLSAFGAAGTGGGAGREATPGAPDDEERSRYGVLLDRAAERGLLTPAEYEVRLRELAEATTVDQMVALVTELPVLATVPAPPGRSRSSGGTLPGAGVAGRGPRVGRSAGPARSAEDALGLSPSVPRRSSPWFILAVVVAILVVAMVFFAVYAEHLVHVHSSASAALASPRALVSALRS